MKMEKRSLQFFKVKLHKILYILQEKSIKIIIIREGLF